ncbi:MAG: diacylglycerol kinase family lipid kinase, partial [Lachnospiraceae bacterium]|nr:diacylglycerol kinase family lipid kinase [Lachnospiraceae bacterium]
VKDLFTMKSMKGVLTFFTGEEEHREELDKMIFAASMNVKAEGGGVPMAPDAEYDDGMLSICALTGVPRYKSFFLFPKLLKGKQKEIKGFVLRDCESMHVELEKPAVVHTDGEYVGDFSEFTVSCLKGKLKVLQ